MNILKQDWYLYGFTNASDGDAKEKGFQRTLAKNLKMESFLTCGQVHSNKVRIVSDDKLKHFPKTDGLFTQLPRVGLAVFTADCMSIGITENKKKIVGVLHAGWRGISQGILKQALLLLKENFDISPGQLNCMIGPHIRSCCYEVGEEVAELFPIKSILLRDEKRFLNLEAAVKIQLQALGVSLEKISAVSTCTCCNKEFFSYRRNGTDKRMLSFILRCGT